MKEGTVLRNSNVLGLIAVIIVLLAFCLFLGPMTEESLTQVVQTTNNTEFSNWSMWGADATHSSTALYGPSKLDLSWKFSTNGSIISSPAVVNGTVYFGSQDKNIYAVDAWSGKLLWSFATKAFVESSLAVADEKVYTGGDDGNVYCLNTHDGHLLWKTPINGNLPYTYSTIVMKSSPTISGGIVYIGSLDGNIYALDGNDGHIVWKKTTVGPIENTPAVSKGAVFFTALSFSSNLPDTGILYKLNANNGNVIWTRSIPYVPVFTRSAELMGSASVANGTVFTSTNVITYYALDDAQGEISEFY